MKQQLHFFALPLYPLKLRSVRTMGPISLISPIGTVGPERPEGAGSPESGVWSLESGVQRTEDGGLRDELDIIQRNGHTKFVGARKRKGP